jgi:hypothetical protein
MREWHKAREGLFPTKLPYTAVTAINSQLPQLEFQRAMRALTLYSQQKPYKGFYMLKYMVWYERAGTDERPLGTPGTAPRGAPPAEETDWEDARTAERREREAYEALPNDYRDACRTRFAEWGWPEGSRAWRLICLDAYVGRDVEPYRIGTNVFTRDANREAEMKERAEYMQRRGYLELVSALRAEISRLGGNVDVVA